MQAAGYQYVNLDDCWMNGRDSSGKLQWNASKFPSGIPALAAYIHGKGLKIGIYETPNTKTCVGIYGGIGAPSRSAASATRPPTRKTFASWGIDFLKYDMCQGQLSAFATMRDALRASGRPIVYSINPGDGSGDLCPPNSCSLNLVSIANMWRIGFDINASWASVMSLVDQDAELSSYAGPGHWNDPDMLEVGNGLVSRRRADPLQHVGDAGGAADRRQRSPLHEQRHADGADQHRRHRRRSGSAGRPGAARRDPGDESAGLVEDAVRDEHPRGRAAQPDAGSASITVQWTTLGLPAGRATVRDLWSHTDLGTIANAYTATAIPSHGVVMLKVVSSP